MGFRPDRSHVSSSVPGKCLIGDESASSCSCFFSFILMQLRLPFNTPLTPCDLACSQHPWPAKSCSKKPVSHVSINKPQKGFLSGLEWHLGRSYFSA